MITTDYRPPAETQFVTRPLDPSPLDMAKMWDYAPRPETNPIIPDRFHPPGTLPHPGKVTTLYPRPFMQNVLKSLPSECSSKEGTEDPEPAYDVLPAPDPGENCVWMVFKQ